MGSHVVRRHAAQQPRRGRAHIRAADERIQGELGSLQLETYNL